MALGAPGSEIFKAFMTEALLLTGLGSAAGFLLGLAFAWGITRSIGIPLALAPASFLWASLLALACGFLFALYPAWKASRQSPMEALRYE
jgi:ABC-type antimicrobial peptide transport system permease subunit